MRTNIEIDDKLMSDALKATGLKIKKEAVKLGYMTLIKLKNKKELSDLEESWNGLATLTR